MGTQAPLGTHFYMYDYQVNSTAFFLSFQVNYLIVQASILYIYKAL